MDDAPLLRLPAPMLGRIWPADRVITGSRVCKQMHRELLMHSCGIELVQRGSFDGVSVVDLVNDFRRLSDCIVTSLVFQEKATTLGCAIEISQIGKTLKHVQLRQRKLSNELDGRAMLAVLRTFKALTHLEIETVRFPQASGDSELGEVVGRCQALSKLVLNRIHGQACGADMLIGFERCSALTHLDLSENMFSGTATTTMGGCFRQCTSLTELNLSSAFGWRTSPISSAVKDCTGLVRLSLAGCNISSAEEVGSLVEVLSHCMRLAHLDLSQNKFHAGVAHTFAAGIRGWEALTRLDLAKCGVGQAEVIGDLFAAFAVCPRLAHVDLSRNGVDDEGMSHLAEPLRACTALTRLDFSQNQIGDQGAVALASAVAQGWTPHHLNLKDNSISLAGAAQLAEALQGRQRAVLALELRLESDDDDASSGGGEGLMESLARVMASGSVAEIRLFCHVGEAALGTALGRLGAALGQSDAATYLTVRGLSATTAAVLAAGLPACRGLTRLDCSGKLGNEGVRQLLSPLELCTRLQRLGLSNEGARTLGSGLAALARMSALTHLDLSSAPINVGDVETLAEVLPTLRVLSHLSIDGRALDPEGLGRLGSAVATCMALSSFKVEHCGCDSWAKLEAAIGSCNVKLARGETDEDAWQGSGAVANMQLLRRSRQPWQSCSDVLAAMRAAPSSRRVQADGCLGLRLLDTRDARLWQTDMSSSIFWHSNSLKSHEGCTTVVLGAMRELGESVSVQEDGMAILAEHVDEQEVVDPDAVAQTVVAAMQRHPRSVVLCERGSEVLKTLAACGETIRARLASLGGVAAVVAAMQACAESPEAQGMGCTALCEMARGEGNLEAAGALEQVVSAMRRQAADAGVQERGMRALRGLATDEASKRRAVALGSAEAVVEAMGRHGEQRKLLCTACDVLFSLTQEPTRENEAHIVAAGGGEAVVAAMRGNKTSAEVQAAGALTLVNLAVRTQHHARLMGSGAAATALEAMRQHAGRREVQQRGCGLLLNLAVKAEHRPVLVRDGAMAAAVAALRRHTTAMAQKTACTAVAHLCHNDNAAAVWAEGGVDAALAALAGHQGCPAVAEAVCNVMAKVAHDRASRPKLAEKAVEAVVLSAMREHEESAAVQQAGSKFVEELARDDDTAQRVVAAGGVEVVLAGMRRHGAVARVQRGCCSALQNMGAGGNAAQVVHAGGVEEVVAAMQRHEAASEVQHAACRTLLALLDQTDCAACVWAFGGGKAVVAAMHRHGAECTVARAGCRALTLLAQSAEVSCMLGAAGGAEAVVAAMASHPEDVSVQAFGGEALAALATQQENRARIVGAGGVEAAVAGMRMLTESVSDVCRGLQSLAEDKDGADRVCGAGGVEVVVAAMRRQAECAALQEAGVGVLCKLAEHGATAGMSAAGAAEAVACAMQTHEQKQHPRLHEYGNRLLSLC